MSDFDEDALIAAVDLVGRAGATQFQFGYLHDDVPIEDAGWYAHAQYRGARVIVENRADPVEAAEALARRLLTGGMCTHCGGLITLSDAGALVHLGATMADGTVLTATRARGMAQCRWRRVGNRWERGCGETPPAGPSRRERRAKKGRR